MAYQDSLDRRRRLTHRALPALGGVALVAFVGGLFFATSADDDSKRVATEFSTAWEREDYPAMYSLLSSGAKAQYPEATFKQAYVSANAIATARRIVAAKPAGTGDDKVEIPIAAETRAFGTVRGTVAIPVKDAAVEWTPDLVFPGLTPGAELTRETTAPPRADIVSNDGKVLAKGPPDARTYPEEIGSSIAGDLAPPEESGDRLAAYARGLPVDTPVGKTGLERILEDRLAGKPGGILKAGNIVLASTNPQPARPVKTTLDTRIQAAAVTALAGRLGGIAALDPKNGEVRALAGIAFSAPQPPGSTFKIVTTAAGLELGKVKMGDKFPVETAAVLDGVRLDNANGETCGGTFAESFAHSCNSVFGPLGDRVGSQGLQEYAEKFGWNTKPSLPGELASTFPTADKIQNPLERGSAAIGQSTVLATPLQMASVAQVIANKGVRYLPTLNPGRHSKPIRVISAKTAKQIEGLMAGVVVYGTGTAAQIDGVKVAGKTGTAELEDTKDEEGNPTGGGPDTTDAWFTSYAPIGKPEIAVAALFVRNGSGGATAAPAVQPVLLSALKAN